MNIAIIGTGKMGSGLGKLATKAGHNVIFASRDPQKPILPAIRNADMVILAIPYESAIGLAENPEVREGLKGKTVVDISNPIGADFVSLLVGHTTSAAEEIARRLPESNIVKAFNTVFAEVLRMRADGVKVKPPVYVSSDDAEAKKQVIDLAQSFGFETMDTGSLASARYVEPLADLLMQFAFAKGMGTKIGFAIVSAGEGS